ncbi:MAG: hypothetical protein JWQ43_1787, partial [Glaciihabitans sp.]|nr:hypothetical protein [Glaciihabitans sp.]
EEFQRQHNLKPLVAQVIQDLADITDYLESEVLAQATEEREEQAHRTRLRVDAEQKLANTLLVLATVLIIPSLVVGFTQLAVGPSLATVLIAAAVSVAAVAAVWIGIRTSMNRLAAAHRA